MLDAIFNSTTGLTTLSGTSKANSSVSVYDGTKLIGTVTAAADGTWSLPANVASKFIHSFTEKSTDVAGNTGASPGVALYSQLDHQSLQVGTGKDVLIAGPKDTLTGGAGSDTFVFNPHFGNDTVKDFNVSQDVLAFAQSLFPGGVTQVLNQAHNTKAGAEIVVDANDVVTLTGVTVAQLHTYASDIHFF
jgi:Ca2+-binding RTX toxin-like protein